MAPRKPKLLQVNEPKAFDFDAYILKVKARRPVFTRNLYLAADLVPKLSELDELMSDLTARLARIETADGDDTERSITEVNPAVQLRERLRVLTEEFNELAEEYQNSADPYTFRVPDQKSDHTDVVNAMKEAGVFLEELPTDATEVAAYYELCALYSMSLTCTSHPMSVSQWQALREAVGEPAFTSLFEGWSEAVSASKPTAPFSPKPSVGPRTQE